MKKRRDGEVCSELQELKHLLSSLQQQDPIKAITSLSSYLPTGQLENSHISHQYGNITSFLLSLEALAVLECEFYWLLDQSGVLDFHVFLSRLSDTKHTFKLSTFLRKALLEPTPKSDDIDISNSADNDPGTGEGYKRKMNTLISTSIASDICLYLFQMIVEDDLNNKKEVCERILEETMGIYRDGST